MSGALELHTEPFGGSPLVRAALDGRVPAGWYAPVPAGADEWRLHADAVRRQFAAGAWLELLIPALEPEGAATDRLIAVARGAGVVVTTGQQPGLFGGPLYTLSKALSARALADVVEARTGVPCAPVFWAATDDADFAEACRTFVARGTDVLELVSATSAPEGTPMSAVPLDPRTPEFLAALLPDGSAVDPAVLPAVAESYRAGGTVGGAYVRLLRRLLAPLGISVLDASHQAVRGGAFQLLRRALLAAAPVEAALAERSAAIEAAGFVPQVADVEGRSLVFRYDADGTKARVPTADARALVSRVAPGELGPNVLLRPAVERLLLPTVAYVAGPGEYAYFAQVSAVAAALAVPPPLAVPRWSATVVEPHVRRALDRLGVEPRELQNADGLLARLGRRRLPPATRDALDALRASTRAQVAALLEAERLTGARAVEGARGQLEHRIDRLERRLAAAAARRDDAMRRDVGVAAAALYPAGVRQERRLNAMPLLARHGPALVDAMLARAREHAEDVVEHGVGRGARPRAGAAR